VTSLYPLDGHGGLARAARARGLALCPPAIHRLQITDDRGHLTSGAQN